MAEGTRAPLILGGVLVAAVAAALWLALAPAGDAPPDRGAHDADGGAPGAGVPAGAGTAPRAKRQGGAALFGEVRRTAGREPVAGQEIRLAPERGEPWSVVTDAQGAFRFEKIPHGGPYELSAAAKGCGTIRIPGIALDRNEKRNVGTLWLDPSVRLVVRVRSGGGAPVEGAVVEAFPVPKWVDWDWTKALAQIGQAPIAVARTATDAAGLAHFPEMAVGEWTFTARKDGYATAGARGVALRSDEEPRPVVLTLAKGYPLDGRVLGADRRPVAGALVLAAEPESGWDTGSAPLRARAVTDAEGRYAFAALESGATLLWVGRPGGTPSPAVTLRIPLVPHYDVVLKAVGVLTGKVTVQETGEAVEGASVRTSSWEGGEPHGAEAVTDASGKYSLELPAGPVNEIVVEKEGLLQVAAPSRIGPEREATVHEGATVVHDVAMRRGARLTGVVRGGGAPLAGVRVLVHVGSPQDGFNQKAATTGADGRYEYAALGEGDLLVLAEKEGWYLEGAPANWWDAANDPNLAPEFRVPVPASGEATKDLEMARGSTVTGTVLGPDGEPLAGVRVGAPGAAAAPPTAANGAFRLEGVTPGPEVPLVPAKEGYVAEPTPLAVVAGENPADVRLRMQRAPRIRGVVTAPAGTPVRDARVLLVHEEHSLDANPWADAWRWQSAVRLPVRDDGGYEGEVPFAATGNLLVRVVSADHPPADAEPVPLVPGRESYEVNVSLDEGLALAGRVTSRSGSGIAGAEVSIAPHDDAPERDVVYLGGGASAPVWAVTGADGSFSIPHLAARRYDVRASAAGFVTSQAVADVAAGAPLLVTLSPELSIEGSVVLADGSPVEGVDVSAIGTEGGGADERFGGLSQEDRSVPSDARGAFRVTGLADGRYALVVSVPWGAPINVRGRRVEGIAAGSSGVKITLDEGARISGRVLDVRRRPVPNAWIQADRTPGPGEQEEDDDADSDEWHSAESGPDGSFVLVGLAAGNYTLDVEAARGGAGLRPKRVEGVAAGTKDLEILVEEGLAISGTVASADGKPVARLLLNAQPAEPSQGSSGGNAWTDAQGKFSIPGLAPGAYRVEVAPWGESNQDWIVEGAASVEAGASGVRIVVGRGAKIAGVVVDEAGRPVAGAVLSAVREGGGTWRNVTSKTDGSFEFQGLPAEGRFLVQASAQGRAPEKLDGVEAETRTLRIVLVKGLSASGRVLDASGSPLASATLQLLHSDGRHAVAATTDEAGRFTAQGLVEGTYRASVLTDISVPGAMKPCGELRAGDVGVELRVAP